MIRTFGMHEVPFGYICTDLSLNVSGCQLGGLSPRPINSEVDHGISNYDLPEAVRFAMRQVV